jgi:hypothetical protein
MITVLVVWLSSGSLRGLITGSMYTVIAVCGSTGSVFELLIPQTVIMAIYGGSLRRNGVSGGFGQGSDRLDVTDPSTNGLVVDGSVTSRTTNLK